MEKLYELYEFIKLIKKDNNGARIHIPTRGNHNDKIANGVAMMSIYENKTTGNPIYQVSLDLDDVTLAEFTFNMDKELWPYCVGIREPNTEYAEYQQRIDINDYMSEHLTSIPMCILFHTFKEDFIMTFRALYAYIQEASVDELGYHNTNIEGVRFHIYSNKRQVNVIINDKTVKNFLFDPDYGDVSIYNVVNEVADYDNPARYDMDDFIEDSCLVGAALTAVTSVLQ